MLIRSRDLTDQLAATEEQLFTLPLDAARCKAREIISQSCCSGLHARHSEMATTSRRSN